MQITIYILATCLCFLNADVQRGQVQGQVAQLLAEQEVLRGPRTVLYRIVLYCTPYCTGEALYCTVHTVLYTLLYRWSWSASWPTPPSLCPSSPGSLTTRSAQLNLERKEGYVLFDCVQFSSFRAIVTLPAILMLERWNQGFNFRWQHFIVQ